MLTSICCGEPTSRPEYNICPVCGEHCHFEDEQEQAERLEEEKNT